MRVLRARFPKIPHVAAFETGFQMKKIVVTRQARDLLNSTT